MLQQQSLIGQALARRGYRGPGRVLRTGRLSPPAGMMDPGCPAVPGQGQGQNCPSLQSDGCRDLSIPIVNGAVAAGATILVSGQARVTLCARRLTITTSGTAGFTFTNFTINNNAQMQLNGLYHTDQYAPDSNNGFLKGDCVWPGGFVEMTVTNLDGVNAQGFFGEVKGPGYS